MNIKWSESEIEFLVENYKNYKINEICKKIGRTESSVYSMLSKMGLSKRWSDNEINELKKEYPIKSLDELVNILPNRSRSSILNKAFLLGLKFDKNKRNVIRKYKYDVNHNFFSKCGVLPSYWAGFISADGWINDDNTSTLGIKLSEKDFEHMNKFKSHIKTSSPIKTKQTTSYGKKRNFCEINVYSKPIINDLKNIYNIVRGKTLKNVPPNLTNEIDKLSFIIGLLDGDGTVYEYKKGYYRLTFLGTYDILLWVKEVLGGLTGEIRAKVHKKGKIFSLSVSNNVGRSVKKICDDNNIPYMGRKLGKII